MNSVPFSIELLGYIATFLVAVSFLCKSMARLLAINALGATLFVIYSLIITAYPVALLNAFLVGVNLYQLWLLKQKGELVW